MNFNLIYTNNNNWVIIITTLILFVMINKFQDLDFKLTNLVENDHDHYDLIPIKQSNSIEIICALTQLADNSYMNLDEADRNQGK